MRFLREHNFKQPFSPTPQTKLDELNMINDDECQVSNFLILKSDMNLINKLKAESDKLVTNDMKNIIKPGPIQKKKPSEIK